MKTYYNLYRKGKYTSRTAFIKIAKELERMGWSYQTVHVIDDQDLFKAANA